MVSNNTELTAATTRKLKKCMHALFLFMLSVFSSVCFTEKKKNNGGNEEDKEEE